MTEFLPEGRRIDLADNIAALSSPETLRLAMEHHRILEARAILCDSAHDLVVDLGCMRGVIPREEGAVGIREGTVRDIAVISRVGRPVAFTVTGFARSGDGASVAVLSRAAAQRRCIDSFVSGLAAGDVIDTRVTHLEPFGAFCDIGCGVVALMPIDAISISRIEHPDERFRPGMDIKAVVKSRVGTRVTLSHKELLGTWEENVARFAVGETVPGIIRSIENYGAFVELMPNLAGLAELKDGLHIGGMASVYIKSIIPQKMKVKLIIIDTFPEAAAIKQPEYYISEGHIDRFVYSPPACGRCIETVFADIA